jgi:hypothetical protein
MWTAVICLSFVSATMALSRHHTPTPAEGGIHPISSVRLKEVDTKLWMKVKKLAVRLVGRKGRRRFDQESKDRLVAACLEPGASVSKLAREHGVNANLVWKWIRKHTPDPSIIAVFAICVYSRSDRRPEQRVRH